MELPKTHIFQSENMENKVILPVEFVLQLELLPENGMGYHIVDIYLKNGSILKQKIVLNCEILKLDDSEDFAVDEIVELHLSN